MSHVTKIPLVPDRQRDDGLTVKYTDAPPELPPNFGPIYNRSFVWLPPGQLAGGHTHTAEEAYTWLCDPDALDQIKLLWLDTSGKLHIETMRDGWAWFIIRSHVPHAVWNASSKGTTLTGLATGLLNDVQPVDFTPYLTA